MYTICAKCKECGKVLSLTVELDIVGSDEREMGPELYYSGTVDEICSCGNKIRVDIDGSEYPEGAGIEDIDINISGGFQVRCE